MASAFQAEMIPVRVRYGALGPHRLMAAIPGSQPGDGRSNRSVDVCNL